MQNSTEIHKDPLRAHIYDGIQEYDNRLPNWWLWTFYGSIIFAIGYWFYDQQSGNALSADARLQQAQAAITARAASQSKGPLTDEQMWALSQEPATVAAGAATFATTCASCHGENLQGKIGPNLTDQVWIHGGTPVEIVHTITTGVGPKGMPTWGPILGAKRINEVAAFILNHHKQGEPIIAAP